MASKYFLENKHDLSSSYIEKAIYIYENNIQNLQYDLQTYDYTNTLEYAIKVNPKYAEKLDISKSKLIDRLKVYMRAEVELKDFYNYFLKIEPNIDYETFLDVTNLYLNYFFDFNKTPNELK